MKLFIFPLFLFLIACGQEQIPFRPCTTTQQPNGDSITSCPDGTSTVVRATPQGVPGATGSGCVASAVTPTQDVPQGGAIITCGDSQVLITNGALGLQGPTGMQGVPGAVGDTGVTGSTGADAIPTPYSIVDTVQPCGPNSSPWKEVLLLLTNGQLLADFSLTASGLDTRLAFIPDGSYVDTDESGCMFTVSTTGNTRTVSWSGGSKFWVIP